MIEILKDILITLFVGYPIPPECIDHRFPAILQQSGGVLLSIIITVISMIIGLIGAMVFSLAFTNRYLSHPLSFVITTIRAVPVIILILFCFYLPYPLFHIRVPATILAITGLSIYSMVYLITVFKSGQAILSSELKQSARLLGFSTIQQHHFITLPLTIRAMLPAILGVGITVFKDSSILVVVGVAELTFTSRQMVVSTPLYYSLTLFLVILIYWSFAFLLSTFVAYLEKIFFIPGWLQATKGGHR